MFKNTVNKILIEFGTVVAPTVQRAMQEITDEISRNKTEIIDYMKDVGKGIEDLYQIIKRLNSMQKSLPGGALEYGIIGVLLFGGKFKAATIVFSITAINEALKSFDMNIGSLIKKGRQWDAAFENIWDVLSGKKHWHTGDLILSDADQKKFAEFMKTLVFSADAAINAWVKVPVVFKETKDAVEQLNNEEARGLQITEAMEAAYQDRLDALREWVDEKIDLEETWLRSNQQPLM
ncbi:unnamed protein product [marine sediment metagenome]|uniref:Dynamin-like helical domain-containing protein n=1 Tax=marine sediment metagenome TaxID=412755 RepID=X1C2M5_9ZZZZ